MNFKKTKKFLKIQKTSKIFFLNNHKYHQEYGLERDIENLRGIYCPTSDDIKKNYGEGKGMIKDNKKHNFLLHRLSIIGHSTIDKTEKY